MGWIQCLRGEDRQIQVKSIDVMTYCIFPCAMTNARNLNMNFVKIIHVVTGYSGDVSAIEFRKLIW